MLKKFQIIYQDSDIMVLDKPAGLSVESQKKSEQTLETILKGEGGINLPRGGIVHRLDKDTSGLMVVAKTKEALVDLQNQFTSHSVKKTYYTLVFGKIEPKKGTIKISLKRDPKNRTRFVASRSKDAKEAITHYSVINHFKSQTNPKLQITNRGDVELSLLNIQIETGRTHQIRAHLFAIGYPIVGDQVYKSRDSEIFSKKIGLSRQFLHSSELSFKHPKTGEMMQFQSDLPEDLKVVIGK